MYRTEEIAALIRDLSPVALAIFIVLAVLWCLMPVFVVVIAWRAGRIRVALSRILAELRLSNGKDPVPGLLELASPSWLPTKSPRDG